MSEYWFKIGNFTPEITPTNHFSYQKTRLNDLLYGIKIWTDLSSILSQSTRLTDRRTAFSSLDRICIACSAVKRKKERGGEGVVGTPTCIFRFCIDSLCDCEVYNSLPRHVVLYSSTDFCFHSPLDTSCLRYETMYTELTSSVNSSAFSGAYFAYPRRMARLVD